MVLTLINHINYLHQGTLNIYLYQNFLVLYILSALTNFLLQTVIPHLIVSIKNKYISESEINSNSIFVIFNIHSQLYPGNVNECLQSNSYVS